MSVHPAFRPGVDCLEHRELPAGISAYVSGGNLVVQGTTGSDFILVNQTGNQLSVAGVSITTTTGRAASVSTSGIVDVLINGDGGNDVIELPTVKINALIYGGAGNDTVILGSGNQSVLNGGGFDSIYRNYNPANPFAGSESAGDPHQGQNPLCQTGAALSAAVSEGFNFANSIQYLGNDWYQVKLYGDLTTQKVYFDGWTDSVDQVEPSNSAFWTVLMQRARLQAMGINPYLNYTTSQWNAFNQQTGGELYSAGAALDEFTGYSAVYNSGFSGVTPQSLQTALARGDSIVAQSQAANYISANYIIGNHSYAVLSVYEQAGVWYVSLYNPWGVDAINGITVNAANSSQAAANDGYITLTWAQFTSASNFVGYYDAKRG